MVSNNAGNSDSPPHDEGREWVDNRAEYKTIDPSMRGKPSIETTTILSQLLSGHFKHRNSYKNRLMQTVSSLQTVEWIHICSNAQFTPQI